MKSSLSERTPQQLRHSKWLSVAFILILSAILASPTLFWLRRVEAATVLDPCNPLTAFLQDGNQTFSTSGTPPNCVLTLTDGSLSDFIAFFANDLDAQPGKIVDVFATFQVVDTTPNNADVGNRIVVNDAQSHAAKLACVSLLDAGGNPIRGVGLLSTGTASDPASYPVVALADWIQPTTVQLRRWDNGDAEIVTVNGGPPTLVKGTSARLAPASLPPPTRTIASVEFGAASVEATCTVAYSAFHSERVVNPVAGTLNFTRLRLRDSDSVDRIQLRADYTLGAGSDGINPVLEPVSIKLSTPAGGQFYPLPDFNPLAGFNVQGAVGKRRWTLNDSERARTGIESLIIDENSSNRGSISLREFRTNLANADFSIVNVEITIGTGATADRLTGTANLVQKPAGSGEWRLASGP